MSEETTTTNQTTEGNSQGNPTVPATQQSVATPPAETQPSNSANGGATQQPGRDEAMFTQADINRIVKKDSGRAAKSAVRDLLTKLGLDNEGDLEAIVSAKREADEAAKTELQKAQEARQQAEQTATVAIKEANDKLIRAAFLAEAGKVQAQHPQDAYLLADISEVEITDDGQVTGVEDAVKMLVESGRLVVAGNKPTPPNLDGGAGSGERSPDKPLKLSQEEIEIARKMRISPEDYQKHKN